jgi:hypothetical protein
VNFEVVRAPGLAFPDPQERTMHGSPALKLGKRLVADVQMAVSSGGADSWRGLLLPAAFFSLP